MARPSPPSAELRAPSDVPAVAPAHSPSAWWKGLDTSDAKRLATFRPFLDDIETHERELRDRSDDTLSERVESLKNKAGAATARDEILPEWFALVREIADRELGERPYEPQLVAGIALHQGQLVEMQTGEGKTLAAVAPVSLNALTGLGVHVLTFNDYLARRDAEWMGTIYARLGLSVAFVNEGMSTDERRHAYAADITYLTVKEAGFDLLRDGLCLDVSEQVHRPFHLALVDEADSILIDEARIPLVIAGTIDEPHLDLHRLADLARRLETGRDFDTDEYSRNIFLTEEGVHRAEAVLDCGNLFTAANIRTQAELRNALHAETLLRRDVDYLVRDGRIELVDELTGRVAENRHWPDGLQAAIEAKEGLHPQPEGRILGSITIQHLIERYPRLCGMTATASSAATELAEVYDLDVLSLPTYKTCVRADHADLVFTSRPAKQRALFEEIDAAHARGRPILVGTVSVEESEELAAALEQKGIACRVLNAKNDAEEAAIVAEAGALGAVTISTNMAGRGTDIKLGGSGQREREQVLDLGGLYVIGTNRHESRRIDDQLRGRAGRQGDPGASRFLISLEDPMLERCGIDRLIPTRLLPDRTTEEPITHPAIQREIERAQRIVEGEHGDIRARLLKYSHLIEHQRQEFQAKRQRVLTLDADESFLARRSLERWHRLTATLGQSRLLDIERRLTLLTMDRLWREHIDQMQTVGDEIHMVQLDGRHPVAEFYRAAGAAYEALLAQIDDTVIDTFERLSITDQGVDWDAEGLRGPSSTWTYLVSDNPFGENTFLTLSTRPSLGIWAVLACWWLLIPWALVLHWKRWRQKRRSGDSTDTVAPT